MSIRFKCPHCKKGLVVKDALAGKKAACPACKKALKIPVPVSQPADLEALAAAAFSDEAPAAAKKEPAKPAAPQFVEFICPMCDASLKLGADLAGKRSQCPECKNIIKVPNLEISKPKDWREAGAKGPSLAAANQPQKLEGAWGTATDKGKVSQEALEEADAILYEEEPQFAGGWLRRGLWGGAIISVLFLSWWGLSRWRAANQQKSSLEQALETVDPKKAAEIELSPAWAAVVHCGAGEFYAAKKEAANARKQFDKAIAPFINPKDRSVDKDLFLMRFAASLLDLGGTEQEAIGKERVEWKDLQAELNGAVTKIYDEEARTIAVRDVGGKLLQRKQPNVASTLASAANVKSQQNCFKYLLDTKEQEKLPNPEKGIKDLAVRLGYAEGRARKKEPAWDIATAKGNPQNEKSHKLHACVGVASVMLEEPRTSDATQNAEPCVKEALTIVSEWKTKDKPSPWALLQLIKVVAISDVAKAKDLIKDLKHLPKEFKPWAQLAVLESELAKTPGEVSLSRVEDVEDEKSLARALAWAEISFHNSKLGYATTMSSAADEGDKRVRPLILIGIARGVQQRNQ